ncbi:type II toxin-antitoxin system Phd/YefM family antitoxin [Georgenia sunbinii]|uniref:type II toxin-antitoxin system Phd/YefM family antitoxin n=1 Tax=Georgenia sunbinii TaxID=3117728 RepID=UPI002F268BA3
MESIGSYEAKTHLARLLDDAAQGRSVTITRHGRSVARLVPVSVPPEEPSAVIDELREARAGATLGGDRLRDLIDEGRQH